MQMKAMMSYPAAWLSENSANVKCWKQWGVCETHMSHGVSTKESAACTQLFLSR